MLQKHIVYPIKDGVHWIKGSSKTDLWKTEA